MWVYIVVVAVAVLVMAAFAGAGRFGEMPQRPVNDRPKGRVPAGPVTVELLEDLSIPLVSTGYEPRAVDGYLAEIAEGSAAAVAETRFRVVRWGYDMQIVDALIERPRPLRPASTLVDDVSREAGRARMQPLFDPHHRPSPTKFCRIRNNGANRSSLPRE